MRIYTEFIIAKEAEKGKSRNEFHCGFFLLRDMRDERIANSRLDNAVYCHQPPGFVINTVFIIIFLFCIRSYNCINSTTSTGRKAEITFYIYSTER